MSMKERMIEELNKDKITTVVCVLTALFFGFALVCGEALETEGELPVRSMSAWISFGMTTALCFVILFAFLCRIRESKKHTVKCEAVIEKPGKFFESMTNRLGFVWFLFLLCWIPVFFAVYPGFFLYDAFEEYNEIVTRVFTTHHPLLHVLALGGIVHAVYKLTGSYNLGIAAYILGQMTIVAGVFAWIIGLLQKHHVKRNIRIAVFLYFAFFPVNVMFVLCSVKDTMFAIALLVALILMMKCVQKGVGKNDSFMIGGALLLAMLLRNNMLYALIVFVGLLFLLICMKKDMHERKTVLIKLVIAFSILLCAYFCVNKGLAMAVHASNQESQEILTVPIQQIARCYQSDTNLYTAEERELLYTYIPEDSLRRYTPNLSDPVKAGFINKAYRDNTKGFWKLWFKGLIRNPVGYLNAWCMTSYGFWYPDAKIDVYEGHVVFTHEYEKSSYFGFETELPGIRDSKIPMLEKIYHDISLEGNIQRFPVLSWFFSMGVLTFVFIICMNVFVARKEYVRMVPYLLPMLVWMTYLLGPTFLPRYMVFQWFMLPVILIDTFANCLVQGDR